MLGEAIHLLKQVFPTDNESERAVDSPEEAQKIFLSAAERVRDEKIVPTDIQKASDALNDDDNPEWTKARIFVWGPKSDEELAIMQADNPQGSGKGAIADLVEIIRTRQETPIGEGEEMAEKERDVQIEERVDDQSPPTASSNNWYKIAKKKSKKGPKPPKEWWDFMMGEVKKNEDYKGFDKERLSEIVGGIWWGYKKKTREKLEKEYS